MTLSCRQRTICHTLRKRPHTGVGCYLIAHTLVSAAACHRSPDQVQCYTVTDCAVTLVKNWSANEKDKPYVNLGKLLHNVVMSPHRAGAIAHKERRRMTHLAGLLNAAARGEPMPNRVDLEAGY